MPLFLGTPGADAHICLVFSNLSSPPSLRPVPVRLHSIPFDALIFHLSGFPIPDSCSGLTVLNTNKTHSTQVEQGARGWRDK